MLDSDIKIFINHLNNKYTECHEKNRIISER